MKTAIKLILIYLGIQLVCGGLIGIPFTIIARMNGGSVDATRVSELTLAPSMLLSMAVMFFAACGDSSNDPVDPNPGQ